MPGVDYRQITDRVTLGNHVFVVVVEYEPGVTPEISEIRFLPVDDQNQFGVLFDLDLALTLTVQDGSPNGEPINLYTYLLDAVCPRGGV